MAETIRKRKKANNWLVLVLLALIAVILGVMLYWNPEPAKAATGENQGLDPEIEATTIAKAGCVAPDFTVEMISGEKITLSELKGRVVLVNFWATWCPPCREELKRVQKEIVERFEGEEFSLIAISRGEKRATVEAFRTKMNYTFPMGLDPEQAIFGLYATNYIPRNFLIDREGRVVTASVGYEPEEFDELVKLIDSTLKTK